MLSWAQSNGRDLDAEIPLNAQFLFPILLPINSGASSDYDHFGQIGEIFIGPIPHNSLYSSPELFEYSLQ